MATTTSVTATELFRMADDSTRYELVSGELRMMSPAGWRHGELVFRLSVLLGDHVRRHQLGRCFGAETGFLLSRAPDTVLAPDIAFIHRDRLPTVEPQEAYWPGPPDLIVEVRSPRDNEASSTAKATSWLKAGGLLVWDVDPALRQVRVFLPETSPITYETDALLEGSELLPGFCCPVRDIFDETTSH